jgi:hypothetical protein
MFTVTKAEAAAIRAAFERGGEFAAAIELRRLFPGVTDNVEARECARTIATWRPLPVRADGRVERLRRGSGREGPLAPGLMRPDATRGRYPRRRQRPSERVSPTGVFERDDTTLPGAL